MIYQNESRQRGTGGLDGVFSRTAENGSTSSNPGVRMQAAICDLTRDAAQEAAAIASCYSGQAAQCLAFNDEHGAERALTIAVSHLKESTARFRAWQRLLATMPAPILAEGTQ
jgi:hypothetical protein